MASLWTRGRPAPLRVGDRWQMSYEIHFTHFSTERLNATACTADDARDGQTIIQLSGKRLMDHPAMAGAAGPLKESSRSTFVVF